MDYTIGKPERPLTPHQPADRGCVPSLGPYLLAAARPRSLRRHGAVTGQGAGSRGRSRADLTDHTTRNGPVRTSAINRRSEGVRGTSGVPERARRALAATQR